MAKDPDNAMEGRMVFMPKWAWKRALGVRHQIEEERERTITSGEENRLIFFAGLPALEGCADCRAGICQAHPMARGPIVDPTPFSPEPKQAEIRLSRARKGKASG